MANLKTTYKDDILDTTQNTKRKFNMIQNTDGTVSFEDVTDYSQVGDTFGAADINAIAEAVNGVVSSASNAASAASTAQSTANNAASAASNAQSTANTAKTNASNAQTTANNAYNLAAGKKNITVAAHTIHCSLAQYNSSTVSANIGISGWIPFAVAGYDTTSNMVKPFKLLIEGNTLHLGVGPSEDNYARELDVKVNIAYYQ